MMITWRSYKQHTDSTLLTRIEALRNVSFPREYTQLALAYDGGIPDKKEFIANEKPRVFQRFISVRIDKHPNIEDALEWTNEIITLIPFAVDPFGNLLCFDFSSATEYRIVYREIETNRTYVVSETFNEFFSSLK